MPNGYDTFLKAAANDRRDAFQAAGARLGAGASNIEKDFWVCWTLDALFNRLPAGGPRLLFKGGTSLSKGFDLISRFSEDIDVTMFRDDLGHTASIAELEAMTGKKRKAKLDAIKTACRGHIADPLLAQLASLLGTALDDAGIARGAARVEHDADDPDGQTLLVWYPTVVPVDAYVRPRVKIESGAKSALDPHQARTISPYVADDLSTIDLSVPNVTTVQPVRTFWDKVVILHGLRRWHDKRGQLKGGGQRVSRHYYDIHRLMEDGTGAAAIADAGLGSDCTAHARMFFNTPDYDLANAKPGGYALAPSENMAKALSADYTAMAGMIFGQAPPFEAVLASVAALEAQLNPADGPAARPPV